MAVIPALPSFVPPRFAARSRRIDTKSKPAWRSGSYNQRPFYRGSPRKVFNAECQLRKFSVCASVRGRKRDAPQRYFCFSTNQCRSVGGGNPVGSHAQGDRGEDAALDPRSGLGPELEVAGSGGHCCAAGSAFAAVRRGCAYGRSGDLKRRARNRKSPQSTEKLLVAVGGYGAGVVVHDAAPSGSDIERACCHIGIRRNIPIKEQHPNSGPSRSVPIVLPFGLAVAHSYNPVRLGFVCNTRISIMPTHMPPVPPANRSKNDHGSDSGKEVSKDKLVRL
jgi:hypothetical protein